MRLIEHKTALYGIQIFLRTNIDTDVEGGEEAPEGPSRFIGRRKFLGRHSFCEKVKSVWFSAA